LHADSYSAAVEINREVLGKGLSKQSWAIAPKIGEIDELVRENSLARSLMREAHPEVCFWGLSGKPMKHSKKSREGYLERMKVLKILERRAEELVAAAFLTHGSFYAGRDDIIDAFVLAVCARAENKQTLPKTPGRDSTGLPMEMVYVSGREPLTSQRTR
jgi:predicted RNase H-like nuclease